MATVLEYNGGKICEVERGVALGGINGDSQIFCENEFGDGIPLKN